MDESPLYSVAGTQRKFYLIKMNLSFPRPPRRRIGCKVQGSWKAGPTHGRRRSTGADTECRGPGPAWQVIKTQMPDSRMAFREEI